MTFTIVEKSSSMRFLALLLAMLSLLFPLAADESPMLSLSQALAAAEENNISLEQAKVSLNQVLRNQSNIMSTFMPSITLSAGLTPSWSFPTESVSSASYDGLSLSTSALASFTFNGSMLKDRQERALKKEAANLSYLSSYDSVTSAVTTAYWQLSVLQATVSVAGNSLEDAEASLASVRESYESGQTDELTLYQTELAFSQAEYTLKSAEDSLAIAMEAFRDMTGIKGGFALETIDDAFILLLPEPEELYNKYADRTLSLRSARNTLAQAELAVSTARLSAYVPTLTTSLTYSYEGEWDDRWDYGSTRHSLKGYLGVSLPLDDILPGGSGNTEVKDAKDERTLAYLSLTQAQKDLQEAVRENVTAITQAQDNRALTEKTLKNAHRSYELSQAAFEAGLLSADDLASSRNSYLSAQTNCLSLEASHLIACYDLAYTLNISFEELKSEYSETLQ